MRTVAGAMVVAVGVAVLAGGCSSAKHEVGQAAPTTTTTTAAPAITAPPAPSTTTVKVRPTGAHALAPFTSCSALLRHVKAQAVKAVTPYGLPFGPRMFIGRTMPVMASAASSAGAGDSVGSAPGGPAADTQAAGGFSTTNIQEAGVDEPDLVKTDGRRLVTLNRDKLEVVDMAGSSPRLSAAFELPADQPGSELLLAGDRVMVFGNGWDPAAGSGPSSFVRVVDIADPSHPKLTATLTMEGRYVSARLANGVVRLVVAYDPDGPALSTPAGPGDEARALAANQTAIRSSKVADWLPSYTLARPRRATVSAPLAPCASVLRPKAFSGLGTVSVLTIDPADPQPAHPACVLGTGSLVYASPSNLYVATQRWDARAAAATSIADQRSPVDATQLHQFATPGRDPAVYTASGVVPGSILNQFSLSEHEGRLRVAATTRAAPGATENLLYVLESVAGRLVVIGKVGHLGHDGEVIHSVRFIGERAYVVTFRQTDPLTVIDLHDPRRPTARGELQMPGFSSYLHPLSDSVLLGVGMGPGEQGGQGLQLSLFDVGNPDRPARIANRVLDHAWSPAQHDHHAFLWWPATNQLVLPYDQYAEGAQRTGALVIPVDLKTGFGTQSDIHHFGRTVDRSEQIQRALVADGRLLTLSQAGLLTSDLASLKERAWLAW